MKLTSAQGEFELTILDYEYSDSPHFLERNWLLVSLKTRIGGRDCQRMAPLLSTWEIELLRDWMRSIATNGPLSPKLTFIEPDLSFRADAVEQGKYQLQIKLARDLVPDWQIDPAQPYWLTVSADTRQMQVAINELDNQLSHFPVRN